MNATNKFTAVRRKHNPSGKYETSAFFFGYHTDHHEYFTCPLCWVLYFY